MDLREQVVEVRSKRRVDGGSSTSGGGGGGSTNGGGGGVDNSLEWHRFVLNNVLFNASQQHVFDVCARDIVDSALAGINGALLAYGQTGAGKTYTMVGPAGKYGERGVIPRTISYVFAAAERARQEYGEERLSLRVSYLEIYQDRLIDLLAAAPDIAGAAAAAAEGGEDAASAAAAAAAAAVLSSTAAAARAPVPTAGAGAFGSMPPTAARPPALHIHEDGKGHIRVRGLSCPLVKSEAEAFNWLFAGEANRAIAEHALNKASTRSHCIFTITVEQQMVLDRRTGKLVPPPATPTPGAGDDEGGGSGGGGGGDDGGATVTVQSKLHLVDLAGSERLEKSESEGTMRREAQAINKSLSFLEQVVLALTAKDRSHVPYRSSKLTHILKDSFTHGKTRLLAAVWPSPSFLDETVCTLRFAMRMMHVKTAPQREVLTSGLTDGERARIVGAYERELGLLRAELAFHDALAGRTGVYYGPLTDADTAEVGESVKRYVASGEEPTLPTLRHYHAALSVLRRMFLHATRLARAAPAAAAAAASPPLVAPGKLDDTAAAAGGDGDGDGDDGAAPPAATLPPTLPALSGRSTREGKEASPRDTPSPPPAATDAAADSARTGSARAGSATPPRATSRTAAAAEPSHHAPPPPPRLTEADRPAELAKWHGPGGAGAGVYGEYAAAKASLRDKKAAYAAIAAGVNEAKGDIDRHMASLRAADARGDTGAAGEAATALAAAKSAYRAKFEELGDARAEVEYLQRVADQLGSRVASEFQRYWLAALQAGVGSQGPAATTAPGPLVVEAPAAPIDESFAAFGAATALVAAAKVSSPGRPAPSLHSPR